MIAPYYQDNAVTIYHGNCKNILPELGQFDLLLTDPPYGINMEKGIGGAGVDGFGNKSRRKPKSYRGSWDDVAPGEYLLNKILSKAEWGTVWGANYMELPINGKWLVWDKLQTMPTYSDAELAWTNFRGVSVKMFRYNGSGLMAKEKGRVHPTQKPLALMQWCIHQADKANKAPVCSILDPFAGSCTTARAAKDLGRKCVCIEREEAYCEIGAKRMQQEVFDFGAGE